MKMISSYVMQDDQLFPMLTVFETFMFAAEVRLPPSVSKSEKKKRVSELLDQLGLTVQISNLLPLCIFRIFQNPEHNCHGKYRLQHTHTLVMREGGEYQVENEEECPLGLTLFINHLFCF